MTLNDIRRCFYLFIIITSCKKKIPIEWCVLCPLYRSYVEPVSDQVLRDYIINGSATMEDGVATFPAERYIQTNWMYERWCSKLRFWHITTTMHCTSFYYAALTRPWRSWRPVTPPVWSFPSPWRSLISSQGMLPSASKSQRSSTVAEHWNTTWMTSRTDAWHVTPFFETLAFLRDTSATKVQVRDLSLGDDGTLFSSTTLCLQYNTLHRISSVTPFWNTAGGKERMIDLDNQLLPTVVPKYAVNQALKLHPADRMPLLEDVLPLEPREFITTVRL